MMAAGSSPRRAVEDPGRLRRAQQPDPDASTHRRTDRTGRSPPPRRMRRCPALTRTPGPRRPPLPPGTRSPRGPPGAPPTAARSRRAPPRSRHQRRDRGAPPAIPRPGPRPPAPQDHTIRPPRPPARNPGRSRERPAPQTPHRIPMPARPNPTSRSLSPTARKTPSTPKIVERTERTVQEWLAEWQATRMCSVLTGHAGNRDAAEPARAQKQELETILARPPLPDGCPRRVLGRPGDA